MSTQKSYTQLGNEIRHRLRDQLNHAEYAPDVKSAFVHSVRDLLLAIFGDSIRFVEGDIEFKPQAEPYYVLTTVISAAPEFQAAQADSDLDQVIGLFAEQAAHRDQQIRGNPDKIRARIHTEH